MPKEVILGESTGIRQLGAGESLRVSGSPTIDLDLEGFGRLTATGPAQSATELKEQLGTTIGLIDGFAARFGTSEVAELRQRHQESTGLELQSANEEKAVRGLLNGRTVKSLRADAGRLDEEVRRRKVYTLTGGKLHLIRETSSISWRKRERPSTSAARR